LVPKFASCLCAFGQVISDVKYNFLASAPLRLHREADLTELNQAFVDMETRGRQQLEADGFGAERIKIQRSVEMRYLGQIHECTVTIPNGEITADTVDDILAAFHRRHEALFTYSEPHNPVELVNLESTVTGLVDKPALPRLETGNDGGARAHDGFRPMLFDQSGEWVETPVYRGELLQAGCRIVGPAVIEEPTTTIVIRPSWQATLHESGTYHVTRWAE
jgi:N-methylhydantoinase A